MQAIRKYQVFVSATFKDLEPERRDVFYSIMRARQIPVGMEAFTAADDRGWEVIRRVIDTSDYYVIIVAGRYGSIDPTTKISWTEREYRYALEKGIKVLAFLRRDSAITLNDVDEEPDRVKKQRLLAKFKATLQANHLCTFWETGEELARAVGEALRNQIQDDEGDGTSPVGWVRGGASFATAVELAKLSDENRTLREEMAALRAPATVLLQIECPDAVDGTVRTVIPQVRLRPDKGRGGNFGGVYIGEPALDGITRPRRKTVEEYLSNLSRTTLVSLQLHNEGTKAASDVEVRIDVSAADDVDLELSEPTTLPVSAAAFTDTRTNGSRNVTLESIEPYDDGSFRVVQRVRAVAPHSDADLVQFVVISGSPDTTFRLDIKAIDISGARAQVSLTYVLTPGAEEFRTLDDFR